MGSVCFSYSLGGRLPVFMLIVRTPPIITFFACGRSTVGQMICYKWRRMKCGQVKCVLLTYLCSMDCLLECSYPFQMQDSNPCPPDYQARFLSTKLDHSGIHVVQRIILWPLYIQMVMIHEKATKLGHDQVTHLEAHHFALFCFVVVSLIFNNLSAEFFA